MKKERLNKKSESVSEVLSWVTKSRKLEVKKVSEKEKALQLKKVFEEQDNIEEVESGDEGRVQHLSKDLAGVKILHGLDKVVEGGAVVLTLKDQSILADGDLNEEVDMLENVEIGEQKVRDDAYKAAKKKTGTYDDKFDVDGMSQKKMLPQYDDPVDDEVVTLDASGRFTGEAEKKLEELRKRLHGVSTSSRFEDLTSSGKISSDYYTQEEMLQFKKPKKKKSMRKKERLDLDALEAEAISVGLGVGDRGSRNDGKMQSAKEEQVQSMTPKEAFRNISHKFHGKGPGKMKQEKRQKQYQEEMKLKQMKNSDTPSQSMERMREAQARMRTPYLVLSGHVRPGQTSDPSSGFATVSDLPGGGLTPMLGNTKVEHFLGIKRKADTSDKGDSTSMGPPKKPRN
ncbi:hypothetical protein MKW92_004038 [Papaver armeniacum]|nr:hypothetical protein MKW92_004038 [Papaver armeniacum]